MITPERHKAGPTLPRLLPYRMPTRTTIGVIGLALLLTAGLSILLLYHAALDREATHLTSLARSHAERAAQSLPDLAALFDSGPAGREGAAALERDASAFRGSQAGEIVFARLVGDRVELAVPVGPQPASVALGDTRARPGQAAARGDSGLMIGLDHANRRVLAAYRPLHHAGYGVVAKVDLATMRGPFVRAGVVAIGLATLVTALILSGLLVVFRRAEAHARASLDHLRESEARFRRLAEGAPDIIYRIGLEPEPHFEYVSAAADRILGYPPSEYRASPSVIDVVHPADRHLLTTASADPVTGAMPRVVVRCRHRDGRWVWIEQHSVAVRNGGPGWVAVEGIGRDVTREREAQEQIAKLSQVVSQSAEAVIITDPDGRIEYVNPAFTAVTGYAMEEVVGQTPRLLKSGKQGPEVYQELWRALRDGKPWAGRFVNRRKDGSEYVADVVMSPVRDADGRIVNLVGQQRDITHQREVEEQLRQAQKMEVVGQLTGGIAHDFNNILTVILANTALLTGNRETDVQEAHEIRAAATRGAAMVRRLLAVSRSEALHLEPVNLAEAARSIASALRRILPETIEICLEVPDLPPVLADVAAVDQMVLNLATNARDAMRRGGRLTVAARLADDADGTAVELAVTDTGTGIPTELLPHVFEPFFTTKPIGAGTGLGLAMVYGIMQEHRGAVSIDSDVGVGTTVRLRFPAAATAAVPTPACGARHPHSKGQGELVLLVEDDPSLASVGSRIIERLGYQVEVADNGAMALALLQSGRPFVLVVSDVVMPGLSGPELMRRVRSVGMTQPFIFTTGYAARDVLRGLRTTRGVSFVLKPWTVDEMADALRSALQPERVPGPAIAV